MSPSIQLSGLAQVNLFAADVAAARDWYAGLLGEGPYFQRPDEQHPAYVEFRIGDHAFELGIADASFQPDGASREPGGVVARWHVDDLRDTIEKLLAAGAKAYEPVMDREAGFVTASVVDPFGNVLGLIQSPHYVEMLDRGSATSRS